VIKAGYPAFLTKDRSECTAYLQWVEGFARITPPCLHNCQEERKTLTWV
jgi:hypothetical protein